MGKLIQLILKRLLKRPSPPVRPRTAKRRADEKGSDAKKRDNCIGECKKSRRDLEEEAGVSRQTKGKTSHGEKSGGTAQANRDFDSLKPNNVKDINTKYGPGKTGTLEDGSKVTVRPGSSDGRPTVEIRNPNSGRGSEIRYNP
ncbi:hypothetical protein [Paracoccus methylarcula]|uniref:hypothetical protein n=1 Tax=Paracoccus methylarcula TaxID=72022 RepID=UPI001B86397A|nr:hypothetical protein [Paracoccus methylarcula]